MTLELNCKGFEKYIVEKTYRFEGVHYVFEFENGYGASVVKYGKLRSYGSDKDLWELAVLKRDINGDLLMCYTTDVTDDVLGWLTDEDVTEILEKIKSLEPFES